MSSSSTGLVPPPSSTTTSLESAAAVVVSASANTTSAPEPPSSLNSASSPSSTHCGTNEVVALRQPRRPRGFFTRGDSTALERFSAAVAKAAASVSDSFPRSTPSASNDPQELLLGNEAADDDTCGLAAEALAQVEPNSTEETSANATTTTTKNDNDNPSNSLLQPSSTTMNQVDEVNAQSSQPPQLASTSNMLRVPPSGYGGAIPRRPFSRDSSAESSTSSTTVDTTKTCFCGHYTEGPSGPSSKRGRCKFCRSRAKYVSGQRSFDASRLFGRRRERGEPRRAASEDQRKRDRGSAAELDNEKTIDERTSITAVETTASTSSLDVDLPSTTSQRRTWRLKPSVRRQARLELDVPSAANNPASVGGAPCINGGSIADSISPSSGSRDHGMRTPPGPPSMPPGPPGGSLPGSTATLSSSSSSLSHARQSFGVRRPTTLHQDDSIGVQNSQRYATHVMASDMSGLLAPPSRSGALLRAHTDPTSSSNCSNYEHHLPQRTPNSPPPTYEEVMKQVLLFGKQTDDKGPGPQPPQRPSQPSILNSGALPPPGQPGGRFPAEKPCQRLQNDFCWTKQPRVAPPSYEEALSSRVVTSLRLGQSSAATASGSHGGHGGNIRSLSEDRATSHPSPPPPFRGRNSSGNLRPLTRSSRVEEIPDIYWEQAARELDFCTCRKCQARYRQYFEEDLADPNNDAEAMIPMETQVLMQEVLTDGMAFCSLM